MAFENMSWGGEWLTIVHASTGYIYTAAVSIEDSPVFHEVIRSVTTFRKVMMSINARRRSFDGLGQHNTLSATTLTGSPGDLSIGRASVGDDDGLGLGLRMLRFGYIDARHRRTPTLACYGVFSISSGHADRRIQANGRSLRVRFQQM